MSVENRPSLSTRKLFGEDDEAGDEQELNDAAADGENGKLSHTGKVRMDG